MHVTDGVFKCAFILDHFSTSLGSAFIYFTICNYVLCVYVWHPTKEEM